MNCNDAFMWQRERARRMVALCCLMALCLLPAVVSAALTVQTAIVSGRIVTHYENNSVKLDNGAVYRPSRKGLKVALRPGEAVTLRYYREQYGGLVFFEYAPGVNSLPALPSDQPPPGGRVVRPGF